MQILMLTASFHPRLGGVEKHVLGLAKTLTGQGHDLSIFTQKHDSSLPSSETYEKINIYRFPKGADPFTRWPMIWFWLLCHIKIMLQADIIHVHDHSPFVAWYLPFRFLLFWKPVYATFHGHEGNFPIVRRHLLARRLSEKMTKKNICIGHYLGKWYGTQGDLITYGAVETPDQERPSENNTIVFIGRLEPDTGIIDYLEAFSLIQARAESPFNLTICGQGSLEERIREIVSARSLPVDLVGPVQDPLPWIQRSRFIFSAGYLTMLEAMASRRLIFALYDTPLKRDYLEMMPGATDMMMIASGPQELAQQFFEIRNQPAIEKAMIARAAAFSLQYTWERLAQNYLNLYI